MSEEVRKTILIVNSVLVGLALLPSLVFVMFSPMLFDAPASAKNLIVWGLFLAIVSFPVVAIAATIAAWILYRMRRQNIALYVSCLPYLNIVVFAILGLFWRRVEGEGAIPTSDRRAIAF